MKRTYWDGRRKRYQSNGGYCVNLLQGQVERKAKYDLLTIFDVPLGWKRRLRDWRPRNIDKWLHNAGYLPQEQDFTVLLAEAVAWQTEDSNV